MSVLVIIEHDRGELAPASEEALTAARDLANQIGTDVRAALIGNGGEQLVEVTGRFGADSVVIANHSLLTDFGPEAWGSVVEQLIEDESPDAVLATGTSRGNEVLAQAAARLDLPFVANAASVTVGDPWQITRVQWGGSLLEDVTLDAETPIVSIGHHAVEASAADAPTDPTVDAFEPELDNDCVRTMVVDRVVQEAGVTLSTARLVVSGGRGVGDADGFAPLDQLAELLGGKVGCSRAVTNNGWRPHSDQVGQTGTRIAPELYIACGISGAIQHWVGAMASKQILAINTDPQANMVVKADYAVVADLHKVVPAISAEIEKRKG